MNWRGFWTFVVLTIVFYMILTGQAVEILNQFIDDGNG